MYVHNHGNNYVCMNLYLIIQCKCVNIFVEMCKNEYIYTFIYICVIQVNVLHFICHYMFIMNTCNHIRIRTYKHIQLWVIERWAQKKGKNIGANYPIDPLSCGEGATLNTKLYWRNIYGAKENFWFLKICLSLFCG